MRIRAASVPRLCVNSYPQYAWKSTKCHSYGLWITFALYSPIIVSMFPGPETSKRIVVQCKGCRENIPAPVESVPAQPIAAECPLCGAHRRYLPSEVFLGRLSHLMIRKPVRTAAGRVG
jgi:hypothetical protein